MGAGVPVHRVRDGNFSVAALWRATRAARASFYEWRRRSAGPSPAVLAEALLANRVYDTWRRSRGRYGAPRVTAALRKAGVAVDEKRVARLMGELGIAGRVGRRKIRTTWRDRREQVAVDLVPRHFAAAGPDQTWVGDVTYVPTGQGWPFVASVLDVHSRRLVGWSIADHVRNRVVRRCPGGGVNTSRKTSANSAGDAGSHNQWERSVNHTIMLWPRAGGRP